MNTILHVLACSALLAFASASAVRAADRFAYGANIGWIDGKPSAGTGLTIGPGHLGGKIYSANCGWIDLGDGSPARSASGYSNTSAADFGVNHTGGALSGYAYGANIGWINFGWAAADDPDRPFIDVVTGAASGFAWGANVGWISLADLIVPGIAPALALDPILRNVTASRDVSIVLTASAHEALSFQWLFNGAVIPRANSATFHLPSAQLFHAGEYSVVITRADKSTLIVDPYTLAVLPAAPSDARLVNLSTRAVSLRGDDVLIPGFVIAGTASKQLLMRVIGPALDAFGVDGFLADPRLTLKRFDGNSFIDVDTNDDWGTSDNAADIVETAARLGAFALDPLGRDAVLLADLAPGLYTIVADGADDTTGIALVELYDADTDATNAALVNISARAFVGAGAEVPIPGLVISDEGPMTLLIRAVGPALAQFGVAGPLADPRLTIFRGDTALFGNDDWGTGAAADVTAAVAAQVGAFALPDGSKDAAMVVTLAPGAYTVVVTDVNGGNGVVLVEAYYVDPQP